MANITTKALSKEDKNYRSMTILQGTDSDFAIRPKSNGAAIDTTGYLVNGWFKTVYDRTDKSHFDATEALLTRAIGSGITNDIVNGQFVVTISDDQLNAIEFKGESLEGVYEFTITSPSGKTSRALYGPFLIKRGLAA